MVPIVSLVSLLILLYLEDLRVHALYMIIVVLTWSAFVFWKAEKQNTNIRMLWGWAIVLRVGAMFLFPTLSDDIFRYCWEGFLITEGGNPYWVAPIDSAHTHWSKEYVNHPELTSIYPVGAQIIFAWLSMMFDSIWGVRLMSVLCDLGILWILIHVLGVSKWTWIYALHPLPILENASSGHMESWSIFPFVCAIVFPNVRIWFLWLGGLIKLLPAVLIPMHLRSISKGIILVFCTAMLFLWFSLLSIPNGAQQYAQHWYFFGSVFPIIDYFFVHSRLIVLGIGVGILLYIWRKIEDISVQAFWLVSTFVLLSPTVHPWYLLWVFPLALMHKHQAWLILCAWYPLWYVAFMSWEEQSKSWNPPMWPQVIVYGSFLCVWLWKNYLSPKNTDS